MSNSMNELPALSSDDLVRLNAGGLPPSSSLSFRSGIIDEARHRCSAPELRMSVGERRTVTSLIGGMEPVLSSLRWA